MTTTRSFALVVVSRSSVSSLITSSQQQQQQQQRNDDDTTMMNEYDIATPRPYRQTRRSSGLFENHNDFLEQGRRLSQLIPTEIPAAPRPRTVHFATPQPAPQQLFPNTPRVVPQTAPAALRVPPRPTGYQGVWPPPPPPPGHQGAYHPTPHGNGTATGAPAPTPMPPRTPKPPPPPPSEPAQPASGGGGGGDKPPGRGIVIDGRVVYVATEPQPVAPARFWDKEERALLDPEAKQTFINKATSYTVLGKDNKLAEQSTDLDAQGLITEVERSDRKIAFLRSHLKHYDLLDVFQVVIPKDTTNGFLLSSEIQDETIDLLEYPTKVSPEIVATSCYWFNCCLDVEKVPYIRENMVLTYQLLQNNTENKLLQKCISEYNEWPEQCQGGPLLFALLYRRIQRTSEAAITNVRDSLKTLRIKDVPNEDVDQVVTHIKTVYSLLSSNSNDLVNYVPQDFPERILTIMTTSSNTEFNRAFFQQKQDVRAEADKKGSHPQWPKADDVCTQAQNMYRRLKGSEKGWLPKNKQKQSAFPATTGNANPGPRQGNKTPRKCWNCDSTDHLLPKCPHDKDQAKIDKRKKAFMDAVAKAKAQRSQNSQGAHPADDSGSSKQELPETYITDDGKPMKRNKKGAFVLDTKAWNLKKQEDSFVKACVSYTASQLGSKPADQGVAPPPAPAAVTPSGPTFEDTKVDDIQASLARFGPKFL